jgi:hypothetical protein
MDYAPTTCKNSENGWKSMYDEDENEKVQWKDYFMGIDNRKDKLNGY